MKVRRFNKNVRIILGFHPDWGFESCYKLQVRFTFLFIPIWYTLSILIQYEAIMYEMSDRKIAQYLFREWREISRKEKLKYENDVGEQKTVSQIFWDAYKLQLKQNFSFLFK